MLADLLADSARRYPDRPAVIIGDRATSYREVQARSRALASGLAARGIAAGDRVAFLLPNGLDIVLCYYACLILGAIAVPVNIRFPAAMIAHVLDHSGARVLISDPALYAAVQPVRGQRPALEANFLTDSEDFARLFDDRGAVPDAQFAEAAPAALFYTSGTTDLPKGVVHTHGSLQGAVDNQIAAIRLVADDTTLVVLPLCYLIAFGSQILPFHAVGATTVVLPGFDAHATLAALAVHRPSKLFGFPKIYADLAEAAGEAGCEAGRLNFCFSGGEAIAIALQQRFKAVFGLEVTEGCGMTETHIYSLNAPYGAKKVGSIGRPIAGMEMRLVDAAGRTIEAADVIGEIAVRGSSLTAGYWRDPARTAERIRGGWLFTGDLGRRDADGDYWFFSRAAEVIRRGDVLVSPLEVEAALYRHPSVREVGVVGVADGCGGQTVVAHVVLKDAAPAVDARDLIAYAAARLPPGKAPERIVFSRRLPYGLTGKIDRRALSEM